MCFFNMFRSKIKIAEEDIKIIKLLEQDEPLRTFFQGHPIPEDGILEVKDSVVFKNLDKIYSFIEAGAIHSYKKLPLGPPTLAFQVCEGIIPTGTKYIENEKEFVSEKIVLDLKTLKLINGIFD